MLAAMDIAMDLSAQRQKKLPYLSYTIHIAASISVYRVLRRTNTQRNRGVVSLYHIGTEKGKHDFRSNGFFEMGTSPALIH